MVVWAAFEQDQLAHAEGVGEPSAQIEAHVKQWETLLPTLAISGVILSAVTQRDHVAEGLVALAGVASVLFVASLAMRNWWGHRLATQLRVSAFSSSSKLEVSNRELEVRNQELLRTQLELEKSRDSYAALYDRAPAGYLTLNAAGEILRANRTAEGLLGVPPSDLLEASCVDLVSAEDRPRFKRHLAAALSTGSPQSLELEMSSATFLRFQTVATDPDQDSERQLNVSLLDVSKRRRAELELARHRENLEELVEDRTRELEESREALYRAERLASLGTLAAGLAHELNNPLGMMQLRADEALLMRDVRGYRGALAAVNEQVRRCAEIVKGVLRFSREEASQVKAVDLVLVAQRSVEFTRHYAAGSGVDIICDVGSDPALVLGSTIELEQVLVNLIRNAIEASSRGDRTTVALSRIEGLLRLSVSDEGSGMSDETREHALRPVLYGQGAMRGETGLGLSIAHGIVLQHNGTLQIESQPGKATTVTMEFQTYTPPP